MTWAVVTDNIPDFNRILSVFLTANATGADLEFGVMDDDCHTGKISIASVSMKQAVSGFRSKAPHLDRSAKVMG